jgi:hypothetical protein
LEHPPEETLKRFVAGTASREESRAVVAHLVKGCRPCASALRSLMKPAETPANTYEAILDRSAERLSELAVKAQRQPEPRLRLLEPVLAKSGGKDRRDF